MKFTSALLMVAAVGVAAAGCSDDRSVNPGTGSSTGASRVPDNTAAPAPGAQPAPSDSSAPSYVPAPSTPAPSSGPESGDEK